MPCAHTRLATLEVCVQAREFGETVKVSGIILTKLDGSSRGGAVVSVIDELGLPVKFIGVGEKVEDLQLFDAQDFVTSLFPTTEDLQNQREQMEDVVL